ncbi:MAG: hypothetical protein RIM84_15840 [Alphaproteobacteria bacterium]
MRWLTLLACLWLAACGGVDVEQQRICERVVPALHLDVSPIEIVGAAMETDEAVRIDYRLPNDPVLHWLVCRFNGSGFDAGRLDLVDLTSDRFVAMSPVKFALLKRFWLGQPGPGADAAERLR